MAQFLCHAFTTPRGAGHVFNRRDFDRILKHQGEVFTQVRGGKFGYVVDGEMVTLDRTNQRL